MSNLHALLILVSDQPRPLGGPYAAIGFASFKEAQAFQSEHLDGDGVIADVWTPDAWLEERKP